MLELMEFLLSDKLGLTKAKEIVTEIKSEVYAWFNKVFEAKGTCQQSDPFHAPNIKISQTKNTTEDEERECYKN